jgi:eukaryotic-like serine/threonine-protein kinase
VAVDTHTLPPRYRSPRQIGHGAMGEIYLATDETLGREVVVKVLSDRYAADEAIRERFKREGLAAARLSGESGAVTVFDVGEWRGRPFLVMEHLGGGSLEDRLRKGGAQPPEQVLAWLDQVAETLDSAHWHGIVHRDVKPANLLLDSRGDLHVADFGIASAAGLDSMTITGTIMGTAGYLSPEQAQGERVGPESDLYALGVVAYELLSGHRPFENDSPTIEAAAHAHAPVPPIAERCEHLSPALDPVFRRALAKDPDARYGSAREFVSALREALFPAAETALLPPPARPAAPRRTGIPARVLVPVALLLGAAAAGAAIAVVLTSGDNPAAQVRTVTGPAGTATVQQTVTQPAPPPPPPPSPAANAGLDGHTLNDRGYSLQQRGDYTGALPLLQQAVTKLDGTGPADPYEGYANYNLGYTLYRLGRCPEAVTYLSRAEQLEPDRQEPRQIRKRAERC